MLELTPRYEQKNKTQYALSEKDDLEGKENDVLTTQAKISPGARSNVVWVV